MFSSRNALFILASMVVSCALAYEARTVSITDTRYTDGLATSFDLAFGQGSAANAQAFFANATTTTVTIASSLLEVTDILANANDVNLTFTGGRTTRTLKTNTFQTNAKGGRICVSNLAFQADSGRAQGQGQQLGRDTPVLLEPPAIY